MTNILKEPEFLPYSDNELKTLARASRILEKRMRTTDAFSSPEMVRKFLSYKLGHRTREVFSVMHLNNRHHLIAYTEPFFGDLNSSMVCPRIIMLECLKYHSASIVISHCHPSLVTEPSDSDIRITNRLKEALDYLSVRIIDHMIIGGSNITSFAERGLL